MRVVFVTNHDVFGKDFNGINLVDQLKRYGIESTAFVWVKEDRRSRAKLLWPLPTRRLEYRLVNSIERRLSLQSWLQYFPFGLFFRRAFWRSDVIHFHLIHTGFFALWWIVLIGLFKPVVWSVHDPWAYTGHCIYPPNCGRWRVGCGSCPDLGTGLPLKRDRTRLLRLYKKLVFRLSSVVPVVYSRYMQDMGNASGVFGRTAPVVIPFGVDQQAYSYDYAKKKAKERLGIEKNRFVVGFRSTQNPYKGQSIAVESISEAAETISLDVITLDSTGDLTHLKGIEQLHELGWVSDQNLKIHAFQAMDIFLMPSVGEAFGLMAIEAMSVGVPVLTVPGTSLPEVVGAGGFVEKDTQSLARRIVYLSEHPEEWTKASRSARECVLTEYKEEQYLRKFSELYHRLCKREKP